jgi:hypothetical protein
LCPSLCRTTVDYRHGQEDPEQLHARHGGSVGAEARTHGGHLGQTTRAAANKAVNGIQER